MKRILKQFVARDAHPAVQFIKYGIAGGVATVVDVGLFYFLSLTVFPALQPDDELLVGLAKGYEAVSYYVTNLPSEGWLYNIFHFQVDPIAETLRKNNFIISRCCVFVVSNFTAYVLNAQWVFKPGRHSRQKELTLFYTVSLTSFVVGTGIGWGLINYMGISTSQAYIANLVSAILINYVCRKYLIFKG